MSLFVHLTKHPLIAVVSNHIDSYPTPINLSYMWSFGSLAGLALVIQIITGVLLAMHYAPEIHLAFTSVEHIMRDVRGGVALRYIHANGALIFFIVILIFTLLLFKHYKSHFNKLATTPSLQVMGILGVTQDFLYNSGVWIYNHPLATLGGIVVITVAVIYGGPAVAAAAGAAGPVNFTSTNFDSAGTVVDIALPLVVTHGEIPRVLCAVVVGATTCLIKWYTGDWTTQLTPFKDLTPAQLKDLHMLAERMLEQDPDILYKSLGHMRTREVEWGFENIGNLSGILAGNSLEETQLVMSCVSRLVKIRATGGFAGTEGTVTFDTIVTITSQYLKLGIKGKHQVLMLYHLIETFCQIWRHFPRF